MDNKETGIKVERHVGTWSVIDSFILDGVRYHILEHDEYGNTVGHLIRDPKGNIVAEDVRGNSRKELREAVLGSGARKRRMVRLQTKNGTFEVRGSMIELHSTLTSSEDLRMLFCEAPNGDLIIVNWENVICASEVDVEE